MKKLSNTESELKKSVAYKKTCSSYDCSIYKKIFTLKNLFKNSIESSFFMQKWADYVII